MNRLSRVAIGVGLVLATAVGRGAFGGEPELLPQELRERGWIQLFDGETLFGWQPTGSAEWRIENGTVRTDGEKPGFLMTTGEFADYELSLEFLAEEETNSGVFLRTPLEPTDPARDCYEVNIAPPDNPFPTGSLVVIPVIEATLRYGIRGGLIVPVAIAPLLVVTSASRHYSSNNSISKYYQGVSALDWWPGLPARVEGRA
jgi:hypothetical protein